MRPQQYVAAAWIIVAALVSLIASFAVSVQHEARRSRVWLHRPQRRPRRVGRSQAKVPRLN
jgi:hypothetical protein